MFQSIHIWFTSLNWDMWAGIGQIIGALATIGTAWIALRQVNIANKQIEDARKREEEAKQKELEAMKPELNFRVSVNELERDTKLLRIFLYLLIF